MGLGDTELDSGKGDPIGVASGVLDIEKAS
jgi:hypothetical protein